MGRVIKTVLIVLIVIFHIPKVFAQVVPCQPIYGGGKSCTATQDITIDSKVLNPSTNKLVDNLGANDAKYKSGFIVTFQIAITNNKKVVIEKTNVQNIFPQFVSFSSGPGNFDAKTRTLTFDADNLMPSERRIFNIFGRIVGENQLSFPENVICLANQIIASVPDPAAGQDSSQLCIEKKTASPTTAIKGGFPILSPFPIKTTPATGPETLTLFSLIPIGALGWFLRRKSKQPPSP